MNPSGISALAECLHCPELKTAADEFIYQHFTDVYKLDEFLQLDVKQVTHLLHQDALTVRAEDQVSKIVATMQCNAYIHPYLYNTDCYYFF